MPACLDQGQLGSCIPNAIAGAYEFDQMQERQPDFMPSRLFIYFNEQVMVGTVDIDAGAMLRDGIKSVTKLGVCTETSWPYDIAAFADKPGAGCFKEALKHQAIVYRSVPQQLNQLQACLATGIPFVFGCSVYESFESAEVARTGVVNMPPAGEKQVGGHAVVAGAVATTAPPSASPCPTRGARSGARRATTRCPSPTSPTRSWRWTSGASTPSRRTGRRPRDHARRPRRELLLGSEVDGV